MLKVRCDVLVRRLLGDVRCRRRTRVVAYRCPTTATSGAVAVAATSRSLLRLPDGAAADVLLVVGVTRGPGLLPPRRATVFVKRLGRRVSQLRY